jgi:hypothetical protein
MKKIKSYIKEEYNVKDIIDNRKHVDRYTISYIDENGYEYRKFYTFKPNTPINIVKKNIPLTI